MDMLNAQKEKAEAEAKKVADEAKAGIPMPSMCDLIMLKLCSCCVKVPEVPKGLPGS